MFSGFQGLQCCANLLGIAAGIGGLHRLRGIDHRTVVGREGLRWGTAAFGRFALEQRIKRGAESIPQFLLKFAIQGHILGQGLPLVLQRFNSIHRKYTAILQRFCFRNQCFTAGDALFLFGF